MDESFEIYSLYSRPDIAQASSTTDGLPTSYEHRLLGHHARPSISGPRTMGAKRAHDAEMLSPEADDDSSYGRRGALSTVEEYIPEPYEEYFSLPPHEEEKVPQRTETLQRRKSTKELINRFETLNAPDVPTTPTRNAKPPRGLSAPPSKPEKKTSPLRQSFRNLISVFKKGKKSLNKDKDDPFSILPQLDLALDAMSKRENAGSGDKAHTSDPDSRFCTSPTYALHSGELLHLLRPSPISPPILPVWMTCSAVLHSTHILLTCTTAHGVPSTEVMSLSSCTDAHSISSRSLDAQEQALLPAMGDAGTPHVFEISFAGKESQRFAAPTVRERSAWVSAIWDAVLHSQDMSARERTKSILTIDTAMSALQKTLSDVAPGYAESTPSAVSPFSDRPQSRETASERDLPPRPPSKLDRTSSNYSTDTSTPSHVFSPTRPSRLPAPPLLSPLSASLPTTPTTPRRTFATDSLPLPPSPVGRTPSPSILNLGQKSVVRQRLAAIERTSSEGSTAEHSNTSSRLTTPPASGLNTTQTSVRYSAIRSSLIKRKEESLTFPLPPPAPDLDRGLTSIPISPTSSVSTSRPKSAFRMRDEMREARLGREKSTFTSSSSPISPVHRSVTLGGDVDAIIDIMDAHAGRQHEQTQGVAERVNVVGVDVKAMRDRIERNGEGLADVAGKVDALRREIVRGREEDKNRVKEEVHVLANEKPRGKEEQVLVEGLQDVREKLDALLAKSPLDASGSGETAKEILRFLHNDKDQRVLQMDQQAESVRYLAELNAWLEAFVNNGTAHIQSVAVGVQKLCAELGISDETVAQDIPNPNPEGGEGEDEPGTDGHYQYAAPPTSLLGNLRTLIVQSEMREQQSAGLQATVEGLTAALHEDMRKNAEMRNAYTTESVIGFIDRQREDQERMLKTLAAQLSNDIRGERLRFVEAMKEATAINVQIHVEEFKKELTREVLLMTHEVGRLQRERQSLEHQIADLFAFYAKQQHKAPEVQQRPRSMHQHRSRPQTPADGQSFHQQSRSEGTRRRTLPMPPPGAPGGPMEGY